VERLIERCAGLDVHKASVTATVRVPGDQGGRQAETRTFRARAAGLVLLGDWLASFGVTVVGVESTGSICWRTPSSGPAGSASASARNTTRARRRAARRRPR
jgi:transposase